jgi:hypothetical protein
MFTSTNKQLSSRQILVLTTTDTPYEDTPHGRKLREVVMQKAKDAREEKIEINVVPLCLAGQVRSLSGSQCDVIFVWP